MPDRENASIALIDRYLEAVVRDPVSDASIETVAELLADIGRAIEARPSLVYEALALRTSSEARGIRLVAAAILISLVRTQVLVPLDGSPQRAETMLRDCLYGTDVEDKLRVCSVLAQHGAPPGLVGPVASLLRERHSDVFIVASLVLQRYSADDLMRAIEDEARAGRLNVQPPVTVSDVYSALSLGTEPRVPQILRSNCAAALIAVTPSNSAQYVRALAVLKSVSPVFQLPILAALFQSGNGSPVAIEIVRELVADPKGIPQIRLAAAAALGRCALANPDELRLCIEQFHDSRPQIVEALLAGLRGAPAASEAHVDQALGLLASPYRGVRLQAMLCLGAANPLSAYACDVASRYLDSDSSDEFRSACASMLLAAREHAVPVLLACADSGRPSRIAIAATVVRNVDVEGARAFLRVLEESGDSALAGIVQAALESLGARAQTLLPELVDGLRTSDSVFRRTLYIWCIMQTRSRSPAAIEALADALLDAFPEVSMCAEQALLEIGLETASVLRTRAATATQNDRERLLQVLDRLTAPDERRGSTAAPSTEVLPDPAYLEHCRRVGDDSLLRLFVAVVEAMKGRPGKLSMESVSKALASRQVDGSLPSKLAVSKATISMKMARLAEMTSLTLFTYDDKRAGTFTADAERLLVAARYYLRNSL